MIKFITSQFFTGVKGEPGTPELTGELTNLSELVTNSNDLRNFQRQCVDIYYGVRYVKQVLLPILILYYLTSPCRE